jgi:ComF family protein
MSGAGSGLRGARRCAFGALAGQAVVYGADALLATIVAPVCAACTCPLERPLDGPVCEACWAGVGRLRPPLCGRCGASRVSWRTLESTEGCAACRRSPSAVDAARAASPYDGELRRIVHAFKYDGRRTLARRLGRLMQDAGADVLDGASCVIPVPLHPWRRWMRGFNQAADLARGLDRPVVRALWRWKATPPQTGLTAAGRRRNVRNAFAISPLLPTRTRHASLTDRIVVLVDDVRTTGATLDACARVLKRAGVREVRALTLAIADTPDAR